MRINGWQRLGIIASCAWVLGAGTYTHSREMDVHYAAITDIHVACDSNLLGLNESDSERGFAACNKEADNLLMAGVRGADYDALFIALTPVPLAWAFMYFVISISGWVKRGFKEAS